MNTLTKEGIYALKAGDKAKARKLLEAAIQEDNCDVQAWMWLSGAVETDQERIECLQQVLRIDPNNTVAARGLAQLVASGKVTIQHASPQTAAPQAEKSNPAIPAVKHQSTGQDGEVKLSTIREQAIQRTASVPGKPQEKVIFKVKPSLLPTLIRSGFLFIFIGALAYILNQIDTTVAIVTSIFIALLALGRIARVILLLLFSQYILTTRSLIVQTGILSRNRKTIPIHKIQDVAFKQSVLERLFSIGDVIVESAGEKGAIHLYDLDNCQKRTDQILRLIQRE